MSTMAGNCPVAMASFTSVVDRRSWRIVWSAVATTRWSKAALEVTSRAPIKFGVLSALRRA